MFALPFPIKTCKTGRAAVVSIKSGPASDPVCSDPQVLRCTSIYTRGVMQLCSAVPTLHAFALWFYLTHVRMFCHLHCEYGRGPPMLPLGGTDGLARIEPLSSIPGSFAPGPCPSFDRFH